MVFAKLKNFFAKLIFFPPNFFCSERFPFSKIPKKVLAGNNQLSKKGPFNFWESSVGDSLKIA
jgi:hypothetical protein